jgi:hypothetical protein
MRNFDEIYEVLAFFKHCPNHASWGYYVRTIDDAMKIAYKIKSEKGDERYLHTILDHIEIKKQINNRTDITIAFIYA